MVRSFVKLYILGSWLTAMASSGALAENIPKKVTVDEAQVLVSKALSVQRHRELSTLWYEPDIGLPFIAFSGAGIIDSVDGVWEVNPWTGDVWNQWNCRRPMTPALRKALAEIRQHFTTKERKQYQKLHFLKPECEFQE